jgi:hypothetical protein
MAGFGGAIVQAQSNYRVRKNPPTRSVSGNLSNPAGSETPGRDLVRSLRAAAQVCDLVEGLKRIDERLAAGAALDRSDDLLRFYRAIWGIFDQLGCHAAQDRCRRDFERITGVSWGWFVGALDALGFALLTPAQRHAYYKAGGGVTRGDVEGWSVLND